MGQPNITTRDGHRWLEAMDSEGNYGQYQLSDESVYRDTPANGVNYPYKFQTGNYRTVIPGSFQKYATLPELEITPENNQDQLNDITTLKLNNTEATVPSIPYLQATGKLNLGQTANETESVYNQQNRFNTHLANLQGSDREVGKGWGSRAWGQQGLWMLGGAAAAGTGAAAWPLIGSEVLGGLNLYGAYEGVKGLSSEDGIRKTINKYNKGDYEGTFYSGLGDVVNFASFTFPFAIGGKYLQNPVAKEIIRHPIKVAQAVSENRFRPFMNFADRRRYITDLQNAIQNETIPFSQQFEAEAIAKRAQQNIQQAPTENSELLDWFNLSDTEKAQSKIKDLNIEFTKQQDDWLGKYLGDRILLANRDNSPYLYKTKDVQNLAAHEFGHAYQDIFPFGESAIPNEKYFGINPDYEYSHIFEPLDLNSALEVWEGSPREVLSELHLLGNKFGTTDLLKTHPEETFKYIADRFHINYDDAKEMCTQILNLGIYKFGGKINKNYGN